MNKFFRNILYFACLVFLTMSALKLAANDWFYHYVPDYEKRVANLENIDGLEKAEELFRLGMFCSQFSDSLTKAYFSQSITLLQQNFQPENPGYWSLLGDHFYIDGKSDSAIACYNFQLEKAKLELVQIQLAYAYFNIGNGWLSACKDITFTIE